MFKSIVCKMVSKAYRYICETRYQRECSRTLDAFWRRHGAAAVRSDSYFPDQELKTYAQIQEEIGALYRSGTAGWTLENIYEDYMQFGLDRLSQNVRNYVFQKEFDLLRNAKNPSYAEMLENKIFSQVYLAARGIPVPKLFGQVDQRGVLHSMDGEMSQNFHEWMSTREDPVFCKLPDGQQGTSCFVLARQGDRYLKNGKECSMQEIEALTPNLQIEEVITQHEDMSAIYPGCVNTCRIVTVSIDGKPRYFLGDAFFGSNGSCVSNGHFGGIKVPYDKDGRLGEYGMKGLEFGGGTFRKHPDTGAVFAECRIPCFAEVVELALKAHGTMPFVHSIGWDIAITPTGPVIIEGNSQWGTAGHQAFRGGLRKEVESLFA